MTVPQFLSDAARLLIGTGGIGGFLLLFHRKSKASAPISAAEAKKAEVEEAMASVGIMDEWHRLAVQMRADYLRASQRISRLEHSHNVLIGYAQQLREHILLRRDPPPPDWPDGIMLSEEHDDTLHGSGE